MKRKIAILFLLALILTMIVPQVSATETVPCLQLTKKTIIIGDSNTVVLKNKCSDIKAATIYARVNGTIGECVNDWNYILSDYGGDYNKTMKQLIDALRGSDFDTVVINMGTNHLGGNMTSYRNYYQLLLDRLWAKNSSAKIYVCKILPVNPAQAKGKYAYLTTNENVQLVNNVVESLYNTNLANGRNIGLIDYNTPFKNSSGVFAPQYCSGDGVHMNTAGAQKMNRILQKQLAKDSSTSVHTFEVTSRQDPTCTADGFEIRECTSCGYTATTILPAGEHNYEVVETVDATCVDSGHILRRCSVCGDEINEIIQPSGHSWSLNEVITYPVAEEHGTASYKCRKCGEIMQDELCCSIVFKDAPPKKHWSHLAIDWALAHGVTDGTSYSTFSPNKTCTRAQVVTFLWRTSGSPTSNTENPFDDVKSSSYYYNALLWAIENGITNGTSETKFSPDQECTRAQIITMLWRMVDSPKPENQETRFQDVNENMYYATAVKWALENGITSGTSPTTFSPDAKCTRAQIVTFLYRHCTVTQTTGE